MLAGCGASGQGSSTQPTPTRAATPVVTCDFTLGDPSPAPEGSPLGTPGVAMSAEQWASIAMASADDGWAIGTCGASGPYETFLLHYHGAAWSLYQNEIALP